MTKYELLAVMYSLDELHNQGLHDAAHSVVQRIIRETEGTKVSDGTNEKSTKGSV